MIADPKQIPVNQESEGLGPLGLAPEKITRGAKTGPKPWAENHPNLPIDQAEEMGKLRLSQANIAALCNVDERTVQREFAKGDKSEFVCRYKRGEMDWCQQLRAAMAKRALNGSDALAIFMAKNDLGMTDRPLVEIHNTQVTVTEEPLPTFLAN